MFCIKCGSKNENVAVFCFSCGVELNNSCTNGQQDTLAIPKNENPSPKPSNLKTISQSKISKMTEISPEEYEILLKNNANKPLKIGCFAGFIIGILLTLFRPNMGFSDMIVCSILGLIFGYLVKYFKAPSAIRKVNSLQYYLPQQVHSDYIYRYFINNLKDKNFKTIEYRNGTVEVHTSKYYFAIVLQTGYYNILVDMSYMNSVFGNMLHGRCGKYSLMKIEAQKIIPIIKSAMANAILSFDSDNTNNKTT